jgi:hypothetical protein
LCSDATNILSIVVILVVITGTVLAIIIGTLSIGLVPRFNVIISAADICYTCEVKDSNIKVDIYTI